MKIALCLEYPLGQFGGTEVLVAELIHGLALRHQVLLVSADSEDSLKKCAAGRLVSGHIPWDPTAISVARSQQLAEQLAQSGVQLAHFHFGGNYALGNRAFNLCPIIHTVRRGVPCLSTNHGAFSILDGYCGPQRSFPFKLAWFLPAWLSKQYVLAHLRCEVTVSQYDYRAVRSWYPAMRYKFRQIYHSRLHGSPPAGAPERRKVILCVGSVGLRKGQPVLIEAFGRIAGKFPDWQVVLIGRMADEQVSRQIHEAIARQNLGNRVQLLGPRTDDEVKQWLSDVAIFAMPSSHEGLGLSLQEALFYGCACVASRAGGITDLIQHGDNGLLVGVNQPAELAAALEKLISDAVLCEKFSRRGPQSVLEKDMIAERMVTKYETLYTRILS
jgi:glycosyltransferase involved in cell wall biosynthesis